MRHFKATRFFVRRRKILDRLRKIKSLEDEIHQIRAAQRKLVEDYPELAEYLKWVILCRCSEEAPVTLRNNNGYQQL